MNRAFPIQINSRLSKMPTMIGASNCAESSALMPVRPAISRAEKASPVPNSTDSMKPAKRHAPLGTNPQPTEEKPMLAKKVPNPVDKHVGAKVRARRLMLGMSQEKLADGLGLTFQQVQKYEGGKNRIGASRMQQIAQLLRVQPAWFFDGAPTAHTIGAAGVLTPEQSKFNSTTKAFDDFLTTPHSVELMQDYARLTNQQRDIVARVARALAEGRSS